MYSQKNIKAILKSQPKKWNNPDGNETNFFVDFLQILTDNYNRISLNSNSKETQK